MNLDTLLDIIFPKFCLNCGIEGAYLCDDCLSLIDINTNSYCPFCLPPKITSGKPCSSCSGHSLDGLYSAVPYDNFIVEKLIKKFKYEPFIKDLAKVLSYLLAVHLVNIKKTEFPNFTIVPVPLHIKRHKWRGFNQAEEIAKELSLFLKIPISNALLKNKKTLFQAELERHERKENLKGVFEIKENVKGKNILLIDDVYTTGSTMDECAKILKQNGAAIVWGLAVARG